MDNEEMISRLRYLIKETGCTQSEFAERIEIDASNLSKHLNGRLPINDSLLNKIVVNIGVSKSWLKDGSDLPFAKKSTNVATITVSNNAIVPSKGTPVYDIDVTAGCMPRAAMFSAENIIGAIDVPGIPDNCRIVRVSGDSMHPVINNGDYIAVKELRNKSQIFWGQIYVILLEDYRLVKYLRKHDDPSKVILRSENVQYDDMEIDCNDIRDLMFVQNIIHIDSRM
ncbi:MAG: XRE family transcriptional regulator [Muribaculaceae bacterium]